MVRNSSLFVSNFVLMISYLTQWLIVRGFFGHDDVVDVAFAEATGGDADKLGTLAEIG